MEVLDMKTDIGKYRDCNEDSITFIRHPKNKKIMLLAVADGMGGKAFGDIASSYTIERVSNWFLKKDVKTLNKKDKVISLVHRLIKTINNELIKKYGTDVMGTTLTLAIVNSRTTIVFNIGDSRCYIYANKELIQVTEDDSDVWLYYKVLGVKKDYLRYVASSNVINACIGINKRLCDVSIYSFKNKYDGLLLFSDGVTDIVTDKKILKIIKHSKKEEIIDKIINNAVYIDQNLYVPFFLKFKVKEKLVAPIEGRDNASAVIYMK